MLGPEEIRSYQVYLTMEKELAPASNNGKVGRADLHAIAP